MLETLRQYGRERLDDAGDPEMWRRRHGTHYAEFAERAGNEIMGPEEVEWRERVFDELDNVRSTVAWALDALDTDEQALGVRVIAGLSSEANSGSTIPVGAWAERAIDMVRAAPLGQRAAVIGAAAWNALSKGEFEVASERARTTIDFGVGGWAQAQAYVTLSYACVLQGRYDEALSALAEGLAASYAEPADAPFHVVARALLLLGFVGFEVTTSMGASDDMRTRAAEAIEAARESGHATSIANALFVYALTQWRNDPATAAPMLDESISLIEVGASTVVLPMILAVRALISAEDGQRSHAWRLFRDGIVCAYDKGDLPALVAVLDYLIQGWEASGEHELAAMFGGPITGSLGPVGSLPAYEVPYREAALERARAALGDEAFDAAAARGKAMSLDELVALTRTELERRIS
jgi:non-specific serine/threonine protein kinase